MFLTSYCCRLFLSTISKKNLLALINEYSIVCFSRSLSLLLFFILYARRRRLFKIKIYIYYKTTLSFYTHYYIQVIIRIYCDVLTHISTIVSCLNKEEKWIERARRKTTIIYYELQTPPSFSPILFFFLLVIFANSMKKI